RVDARGAPIPPAPSIGRHPSEARTEARRWPVAQWHPGRNNAAGIGRPRALAAALRSCVNHPPDWPEDYRPSEGHPRRFPWTPAGGSDNARNARFHCASRILEDQLPMSLKQNEGSIINTASIAGLIGSPMIAAYSDSKHAVIGLTKTAAWECTGTGVRVNCVCPGLID